MANKQTYAFGQRAGFTAIELIVVVSVIILLVSLTVPSIMPALKKGAVNDAATAIQRVCSQARQLARTRQEPSLSGAGAGGVKYWGVNVVVPTDFPTKPAYAAVIFGNGTPTGPDTSLENNPVSGKPWYRQDMPRSSAPYRMAALPTGNPRVYTFMAKGSSLGWYYQYRTGFVIKDGSTATQPINVGTPGDNTVTPSIPPGTPAVFGVASLDQKYVMAIAVYSIGLANIQDLPQ